MFEAQSLSAPHALRAGGSAQKKRTYQPGGLVYYTPRIAHLAPRVKRDLTPCQAGSSSRGVRYDHLF
jgi:hypothetical protein